MAKKKQPSLPLTVQSKVKEQIKKSGMNTSGDVMDVVNEKVAAMIDDAAARAQANGRKTVRGTDF